MARTLGFFVLAALAIGLAAFKGPGSPDVAYAIDCDNFPIQSAAQSYLEAVGEDPDQLDGANDNGIACEDLPCPCDDEPISELIGDYVPPTNTPTNTPTRTPVPPPSGGGTQNPQQNTSQPTATATQVINAAGATATSVAATATTAASTATPVAPTATVAPPPAIGSVITPPSTGDAGLR